MIPPSNRIDELSAGERWASDARRVLATPGGMMQVDVDMTPAKATLEILRQSDVTATFTHLVVRAAALALARNPHVYRMVCGYQRLKAGRVDIGLSTGGLATDVPLVLVGVDQKPLRALARAVEEGLAIARATEERLRRARWLTPFGFLRRWLLRYWYGTFSSRRRLAGTFEVSCHSNADVVAPLRFYTDAILSAGRVRDVVVELEGRPVIRPMACLTLCIDHVAMDGMRGAALLNAVKDILEGDNLLDEARHFASNEGAL